MNEKEVNELLDLLVDIKNVLKDIGKVLDKQTRPFLVYISISPPP